MKNLFNNIQYCAHNNNTIVGMFYSEHQIINKIKQN